MLFKGSGSSADAVIEGDLKAYRGEAVRDRHIVRGRRLPVGPRPKRIPSSAPRQRRSARAQALLAEWRSPLRPSAAPMLEYWRELESAWALDLDLEKARRRSISRTAWRDARWTLPPTGAIPGRRAVRAPRAKAGPLRGSLRPPPPAEACLAEPPCHGPGRGSPRRCAAKPWNYSISGLVLELDCARLSAYHELAAGDPRARPTSPTSPSASSASASPIRLEDRRAAEKRFLIRFFYDLRLRRSDARTRGAD